MIYFSYKHDTDIISLSGMRGYEVVAKNYDQYLNEMSKSLKNKLPIILAGDYQWCYFIGLNETFIFKEFSLDRNRPNFNYELIHIDD